MSRVHLEGFVIISAFTWTDIFVGLRFHSLLRSFADVVSLECLDAVNVLFMQEWFSFMVKYFVGTSISFIWSACIPITALNSLICLEAAQPPG